MKGSQENTICTISTKKGEGAIAIIRISGEKSINICYNIFSSKRIKKENDFKANTIYFGKIMKNNKISQLIVTKDNEYYGVLHIQNIIKEGIS